MVLCLFISLFDRDNAVKHSYRAKFAADVMHIEIIARANFQLPSLDGPFYNFCLHFDTAGMGKDSGNNLWNFVFTVVITPSNNWGSYIVHRSMKQGLSKEMSIREAYSPLNSYPEMIPFLLHVWVTSKSFELNAVFLCEVPKHWLIHLYWSKFSPSSATPLWRETQWPKACAQ